LAELGQTKFAIKVFKEHVKNIDILREHEVTSYLQIINPQSFTLKTFGCSLNAIETLPNGTKNTIKIIVMEFVEGGDLFDYVLNSSKFSESLTHTIF
jgi:serine/threonine protein kinase